jgi:uncharacterized protein (TIGR02300 family)
LEKKAELGTKRICPSCASRFYDLGKRPIVCPKCQTSFEPETLLKPRRQRPEAREVPVPVVVPEVVAEEEAEEEFEEDEDALEEDDVLEPDEVEGDVAAEKPVGPAARKRKRPAVIPDEELVLPDADDEEVDVDDEEDVLVESVEDLEDDALVVIDPDLEDDGKEST